MQPAGERRGLARVAREPEYADVRVAGLDRAQHLGAAVGDAVVDEQHLVRRDRSGAEHARQLLVQRNQVVPLVEERNNYREFHRG